MPTAPAFGPGLETWTHPLPPPRFLAERWRKRHLLSPGGPARLRALFRDLGEPRLESLLAAATPEVSAWFVDGETPDYSLRVAPETAAKLYRAGLTIYFNLSPERPFVARLLSRLCRSLGHPPSRAVLSVFATRKGSHTHPHVDGNENFTVQLTGRKRWRLGADTDSVAWRRRALTVDLRPGNLLYCPGSWRHETFGLEDSISLNLSLLSHPWADVVLPSLRAALMRRPDWRETAYGLWGDRAARAAGTRRLAELLVSLKEDLGDLTPATLASGTR